jgi:predicted Zn-dependent peptidase
MAIVGDVTPGEVFAKAEKYLGGLPTYPAPPRAEIAEPMNTAARTLAQTDALARVPAVAVGYKVPMGIGRDYVALTVLGDVLLNGDASRLYQSLVKGRELMLQVQGGNNFPFDDPWRNAGPTLFSFFGLYKPDVDVKAVVAAAQGEIGKVASAGVPAVELARVKSKMRADFYAGIELPINRADALAVAQLLLGDASALNTIPAEIEAVTSADLQRVAAKYLTVANRTVIDRQPAPAAAPKGE